MMVHGQKPNTLTKNQIEIDTSLPKNYNEQFLSKQLKIQRGNVKN